MPGSNLEKVVFKTMIRYINTKIFLEKLRQEKHKKTMLEKKMSRFCLVYSQSDESILTKRLTMKRYFIALHPVYKLVSLS
jgi:hypothetical protein